MWCQVTHTLTIILHNILWLQPRFITHGNCDSLIGLQHSLMKLKLWKWKCSSWRELLVCLLLLLMQPPQCDDLIIMFICRKHNKVAIQWICSKETQSTTHYWTGICLSHPHSTFAFRRYQVLPFLRQTYTNSNKKFQDLVAAIILFVVKWQQKHQNTITKVSMIYEKS